MWGVHKDISQRKQAETELDIMNEKLRVVRGLARHDARNRLASVTGNVFLAKKRQTGKEGKGAQFTRPFRKQVQAEKQTITLLDLAEDESRFRKCSVRTVTSENSKVDKFAQIGDLEYCFQVHNSFLNDDDK